MLLARQAAALAEGRLEEAALLAQQAYEATNPHPNPHPHPHPNPNPHPHPPPSPSPLTAHCSPLTFHPNPNPNPNPSPNPNQAATPPLAVLALGTRVSAGFIAASGAVAVGGYLYARYQPGARLNAARDRNPSPVPGDDDARRSRPSYSAVPGDDDVTAPLVYP